MKTTQSTGLEHYSPHDYQKEAIRLMISQACAGLLLDPGLGKTSISLAAVRLLRQKKLIKGVLVIAPLRAIYNTWPDEVDKWDDFVGMSYTLLHGADKLSNLTEVDADLYFMNPEGVVWLAEVLARIPLSDWPFDVLIVDESTKFKASNTKRFKALRSFVGKFRRRYILTGTITPNGLLDLFGQIYILDLGNALGKFITHFKNAFFYSSGFGGYTWSPRETAMEEIIEKISPLVLRMRGEDYLKLPPLINQYTWLTLPPDAARLYNDLENNFLAEVGDSLIVAPNAAVAGMKCRQVLNGAIFTNEEHDWEPIHDAKLDALGELLEELGGQPLLIFYEFTHDRDRIVERFKIPVLGGQSPKKDSELIKLFNAGVLPGLLAHPASAGHSLNLQGSCAHICWFGITWNLEFYLQAIARVWRQGNKALKVVCHHICIKGSLDIVVVKALAAKDRVQTAFMEGVRAMRSNNKEA